MNFLYYFALKNSSISVWMISSIYRRIIYSGK